LKRSTIVVISILGLVLLAVLVFYNSSSNGKAEKGKEDVRSVRVQRGDLTVKVAETGSIEPMTAIEIKSEQSGEIKKLYVKEGDHVKAGQLLAMIQQESNLARQAAQFRASMEEERMNMEQAKRDLDRQEALLAKGIVSKKDVETAQQAYENAKVRYELARRQLLLILGGNQELLRQYLSRNLSSDQLDEFVIKAPSAGTIIELKVEEGEIISSGTSTVTGGTALMKIADLSRMLAKVKINEVNVTQVKVGQPVEIRLDAVPGRAYRGKVVQISPQGERLNNVVTYLTTVEVQDPDEHLKPTMTANVDIISNVMKDVLYVPVEVVSRNGSEDVVYLDEAGKRVAKKIRIAARTESYVVIEEGLKEGQLILRPGPGREQPKT
jgi:HlyD family secretion protein